MALATNPLVTPTRRPIKSDQDMPPKKKARLPSGTVSTPSIETQDAQTPIPATPDAATKVGTATLDLLNDPWTDEQETSLYKGVIRWKPVGQSECTVIPMKRD